MFLILMSFSGCIYTPKVVFTKKYPDYNENCELPHSMESKAQKWPQTPENQHEIKPLSVSVSHTLLK